MNDQELDRILSREPGITPSEGFAGSVMAAVHRESEMPKPIPFPWRRAIGGLVLMTLAMILLVAAMDRMKLLVSLEGDAVWIMAVLWVAVLSLAVPVRLLAQRDDL